MIWEENKFRDKSLDICCAVVNEPPGALPDRYLFINNNCPALISPSFYAGLRVLLSQEKV